MENEERELNLNCRTLTMTSFNSCERPVKETIVTRMKEEEGKTDSKGILLKRKIGNCEKENRKERFSISINSFGNGSQERK